MTTQRIGLIVPDPEAVVTWTGTANGNQSSIFALSVTTVSGTLYTSMDGMVLVNADGDYVRIKAADSGAGTLDLAENDVTFAAGDALTIYAIRLPFPRYQRVTEAGAVYKDYDIAFPSDYRHALPPAPVISPEIVWVAVDDQVTLDAGGSRAMSTGSSALTVTWQVGTWGTVLNIWDDGGTVTNRYISVQMVTAGYFYLRAWVRDDTTDAVSVRSVLVCVGDTWIDVLSCERSWSLERGWSASGTTAAVFSYLQHSPALLVDVDTRAVIMAGFLRPDSVQATFEQQTLSFMLLSPLADSAQLTTYPFLVEEVVGSATPSDWSQLEAPTLERILWFLLYWHTLLPELANINFEDPAARRLKGESFGTGNMPQQLRNLVGAAKRVVREAETGGLTITPHPLYADDGDWGTNPAYPVHVLPDENREGAYSIELATPGFAECVFEGTYMESGGTYAPARVRAPGSPANWGGGTQRVTNQAPISPNELAKWARRHFVAENRALKLTVAPLVRVSPAASALLQTEIGAASFIAIEEVRESFAVSGLFWTAQVSGRTFAPGVSVAPVPDPPPVTIIPSPNPAPEPPQPWFPSETWGDGNIVAFSYQKTDGDQVVYITENFRDASPTWVDITGNLNAGAESYCWYLEFAQFGENPKSLYLTTYGVGTTSAPQLFYCEDPFAASPTWVELFPPSGFKLWKYVTDRTADGYVPRLLPCPDESGQMLVNVMDTGDPENGGFWIFTGAGTTVNASWYGRIRRNFTYLGYEVEWSADGLSVLTTVYSSAGYLHILELGKLTTTARIDDNTAYDSYIVSRKYCGSAIGENSPTWLADFGYRTANGAILGLKTDFDMARCAVLCDASMTDLDSIANNNYAPWQFSQDAGLYRVGDNPRIANVLAWQPYQTFIVHYSLDGLAGGVTQSMNFASWISQFESWLHCFILLPTGDEETPTAITLAIPKNAIDLLGVVVSLNLDTLEFADKTGSLAGEWSVGAENEQLHSMAGFWGKG